MRNSLLISLLLISALIGSAPLPGLAETTLPPLAAALKELQIVVDEHSPDLREGVRLKLLGLNGVIQAKIGKRKTAQATFQKIFTQLSAMIPQQPDPYSYIVSNVVRGLLNLALDQGRAEDPEGQAATLNYIRSLSPVMTDSSWIPLGPDFLLRLKDMPLHQISPILLAIPDIVYGMNAMAYGTEGGEVDENTIIATQNFLAEAYAALGQKEAAIASLRKIPGSFIVPQANDPGLRWSIPSELILAARLGELPRLQRYLKQDFSEVSDWAPWQQAIFWRDMMRVVSALIDGGHVVEATRLFERILPLFRSSLTVEKEDFILTMRVWKQIAIVYAKLGKVEGVQHAEAQDPTVDLSRASWRYLAEFQLRVGDIEGARRTASLARHDNLAYIIMAQAEHGDVAGAEVGLAALDQWWYSSKIVHDHLSRDTFATAFSYHQSAVRAVAKARVVNGDIWATLEWAREYPYPDLKAFALIGFAEGLLAQQNQAP